MRPVHGHWSVEDSHRLLERSFLLQDQVQPHPERSGDWLVSSASQSGQWHTVTQEGTCDCMGFKYHGRCRHLARAAWMRQNFVRSMKGLEPLPPPKGFRPDGAREIV